MEMGLRGKVVVITGAAGGMGRVIAREFASEGARLLLVDISAPDPQDLPGAEVETMAADLALPETPAAIVERAVSRFGAVDVLVNGVGLVHLGKIEDFTRADWDRLFDVNLKAVYFLSQAVGRVMLAAGGGAIVNLASIAGTTATPGNTLYGISKAAVIALTRQFAVEWGPHGVRCNAVGPGFMTNLMQGLPGRDERAYERQAGLVPTRRSGTPADVAKAVVFLASDAAGQVSGETLLVDGGLTKSLLALYARAN